MALLVLVGTVATTHNHRRQTSDLPDGRDGSNNAKVQALAHTATAFHEVNTKVN
jgi:hypothetical protein